MKLVILDRDGVINFHSDRFIKSSEEWRPIPGSLEAISRLNGAGYRIAVAANQSGIGRALIDMDTLNAIHSRMLREIQQTGGQIDMIYYCPHAADVECNCRKPMHGMLADIAQRLGVSLAGVPCIGDSLRDLQTAERAGAAPYLVLTGKGSKTQTAGNLPESTRVYASLAAAADAILAA